MKITRFKADSVEFLLPIILLTVISLTHFFYGFLLFHTLLELFTVFVGVSIAVISYFTFRFTKNNFILFLGIGYFWVALIDLFHSFTYPGLNLLAAGGTNTSISLWLAGRFLMLIFFFGAPFTFKKNTSIYWGNTFYGIFFTVVLFLSLNHSIPELFFSEKTGLTHLKIFLEYFLVISFIGVIFLYREFRHNFSTRTYRKIILALALTTVSELAFTLYDDPYGIQNFIGHVLKFLSYYVVFIALITEALDDPFLLLSNRASSYDAIPNPVFVLDKKGHIRQANKLAREMVEDKRSESKFAKDLHIHELCHAAEVTIENCPICQRFTNLKEAETIEQYHADKDKTFDHTISPIILEGEQEGIIQVCRDITQAKKYEDEIANEKVLLETLIDTIPARIFWKDLDGVYLGANKLFAQDAGYQDGHELIGKTDFDLIWKEFAQSYTNDDMEVLSSGKPKLNFKESLVDIHGNHILLRTSKVPLKGSDNELLGILGVFDDITEVDKRERLLMRTQKLEALGQLTGGIAHDFNNILSIIIGYADSLYKKMDKDSPLFKQVQKIRQSGERGKRLTQRLMIFSRQGTPHQEVFCPNELFSTDESMLTKSLGKHIETEFNLQDNLGNILADKFALQDALLNLSLNSKYAMPNGGKITISTSNIYIDEELSEKNQIPQGDYVQIEVSDTGVGIKPENLEKIFEPFFTTKEDVGTGLGLSQVHALIEHLKGRILLESEVGKGATFKLIIPRHSS